MSKTALILDSTQLSLFDECPYKWSLEHLEHLEADTAFKEAMIMGSFGHKLLEIYYKSTDTPSQARDQALAYNVPINSQVGILPDYKAIILEPDKVNAAVHQAVPFELDSDKIKLIKDRFNDYWMQQIGRGLDIIPDSPNHVEIGFSENIYESSDKVYILEGKIDLIGSLAGLPTIVDHKFQLRMRSIYNRTIQFRNYAMVAKKSSFLINYIRLTKKVDATTFERQLVSFQPNEHFIWKQRLIKMFDRIYDSMKCEAFEQRWGSCMGKYGYPCDFAPICEEWQPDLIEAKKRSLYHIKQEWKPW